MRANIVFVLLKWAIAPRRNPLNAFNASQQAIISGKFIPNGFYQCGGAGSIEINLLTLVW